MVWYNVEHPNSRIYIPLGSALLPSFVLSLLLSLIMAINPPLPVS